MKKIFKKVLAISGILLLVSCNENIMDYSNPNTFTTENYFKTPAEIQAGSTASYLGFKENSMMGFKWSEMFDAMVYEIEPTPASLANEPDIVQLMQFIYTNTNVNIERYWRMLYKLILRSNLVIDKAQAYIDLNGDDVNKIVSMSQGEAYFLRGYAYSQLAFYFGKVPIRTSFDQSGNEDAPRSATVDIVWSQAEKDFKAAQQLLPDSWSDANIGRATKGSATGFLGKLYLFEKKYVEADSEFAKLDGKYSLLPLAKYMDNFGETNENNQESIFEVQFAWIEGTRTNGRANPENDALPYTVTAIPQLYGWNDWGNWKFNSRRANDFVYNDESGHSYLDPRASTTFYGGIGDMTWQDNMASGPIPYDFAKNGYWYKKLTNKENKVNESSLRSGNNIRLMRYADVLLMRAECKLFSGDISGCLGYVNQVRNRIGAFPYQGSYTVIQAFELLKRERQLELMGEQHRYDDLKRWGLLKEVVNVEMNARFGVQNFQDKHYFFPIPKTEVDNNLGLGTIQNEWN